MEDSVSFEQILEEQGRLVYTNKGISMMPLLRENSDIMIIERKGQRKLKKLDAVLFKRMESDGHESYVMHRILRLNRDGSYWIIGDNCITGDLVCEDQIIGVLKAVVRDGKTIPVSSFSYLVYTNTWCRFWRFRILLTRIWASIKRRSFKTTD